MSLKNPIDFLGQLRKMQSMNGLGWGEVPTDNRLIETVSFGTNPGDLRMFSFVPKGATQRLPLVVVLHGCTQNAAAYEIGAGWCTLAQRYGFALLLPEQTRTNNPNTCFNWFSPDDIRRGSGEVGSIHQMVEHMTRTHQIDQARIFATGLSAGGGMTAALLATYPDVFAGGAVIAGLPYGVAHNVRQALKEMRHATPRSGHELGELVRHATAHQGPWPKLAVWHGDADRTVDPANADALVRQWLDLHGLAEAPTAQNEVCGYPHRAWRNSSGETVVESYTVTGMAHGTPLGAGAGDERYGVAGAYLLDVGISSSYHIAQFFGLTSRIHQPRSADTSAKDRPAHDGHRELTTDVARRSRKSAGTGHAEGAAAPPHGKRGIDVGAVITRALTAAGLMK
ncbi:PHB depolymerase family esterase [Rhodopseudomonas palustris]|uniref:extracellular catalytic domain type 1 short-chain-length polyhydroxyalkanoate depolymerase n=1 Tax=Rhodopseudomonas palustris TaxID=1076 RepID=UPI0022F00DD2|nr:PHB depolymerase family esterase [Rhodopseudomonas palustris]WBU32264.1 PHB depolymerase family esterase [Rhodopseudomonas palustris]